MPPHPLTRRVAVGGLTALAAAAVAGCTNRLGHSDQQDSSAPARRARTNPDAALAASVLAQEQAMLAKVRATLRTHPHLAAPLAGAEDAHRAHVRLLARAVPRDQTPAPVKAATPGPEPVPARPGPALAALARAEDRLSLTGRHSSFAARSGAFARVLASMAASAAQQAAVLTAVARDRA